MEVDIERVNGYEASGFSPNVLAQHGCFLVDGEPYEVEIISESEAVVRGKNPACFGGLIEEFRFYAPHIWLFYDDDHHMVREYERPVVLEIALEEIQPSQFYVDADKVKAIQTFVQKPEDIIIQAKEYEGRYILLDGHTRLYYAASMGFQGVRAVLAESGSYIYDFVQEAIRRNVHSPRDLVLLSHGEYEVKWNSYCDEYFSRKS